ACCPPNIARTIAQLGAYVAAVREDEDGPGLELLQHGAMSIDLPAELGTGRLEVETSYPDSGLLRLRLDRLRAAEGARLGVRIPGWVRSGTVALAGSPARPLSPAELTAQRLELGLEEADGAEIGFDMPPRWTVSHPRVDATRDCLALERGPLVHCLEQVDMPDGVAVDDLRVPAGAAATPREDGRIELALHHVPDTGGLYRDVDAPAAQGTPVTVTAVPFARWGNRGPGAMRIWLPRERCPCSRAGSPSPLEPARLDQGDPRRRPLGAQQAHHLADGELADLDAARVQLRHGGQQRADVGEVLPAEGDQQPRLVHERTGGGHGEQRLAHAVQAEQRGAPARRRTQGALRDVGERAAVEHHLELLVGGVLDAGQEARDVVAHALAARVAEQQQTVAPLLDGAFDDHPAEHREVEVHDGALGELLGLAQGEEGQSRFEDRRDALVDAVQLHEDQRLAHAGAHHAADALGTLLRGDQEDVVAVAACLPGDRADEHHQHAVVRVGLGDHQTDDPAAPRAQGASSGVRMVAELGDRLLDTCARAL